MKIAFFMRPDPPDADAPTVTANVSQVSDDIVHALRARGAEVDEIVPEAGAWDLLTLRPHHDLYILKSKNPLDLDLAESLERVGARVINTAHSSRLAKDKIVHTTLLARAGVPQPDSWAVASLAALRDLLTREPGACLVKPPAGSMAQGIHSLTCAEDLDKTELKNLRHTFVDEFGQPNPLLVQRKVTSDGTDLKVYVVGDWVRAVERPLEGTSVTPVKIPDLIRDTALTCGQALGLDVYGVDFMRDPHTDRFWVVDVNAFPSYRGIEGATERIADLLVRKAAS